MNVCNETGRMLVYQWKCKQFPGECSVVSEMSEFLGLKAFRFVLKFGKRQHASGDCEKSKTSLYFLATNLHKTGFKVAKVSAKIKGKLLGYEHLKARDNVEHMQIFSKEYDDYEWLDEETEFVTFSFHVHVIETLSRYQYHLSDVLFMDQLWLAAQNKQWTDIEFAVKNHVYSAHRVVLAARSPIFISLVDTTLVPGGRIKIEHTDPIVFEMFLKFIYTGVYQVSNNREINQGVSRLAEEYHLTTLKSLCQLAVQHTNSNQLTALAVAMRPDLEFGHKKPRLMKGKANSQLFPKKHFTVVECFWNVEGLPDVDQVFSSDLLNFRIDGGFRAGLADHPATKPSTLLTPQYFLYLACSHLEKTGTVVYHVDSFVDGADYSRMDRTGEEALILFGRELYDLKAPMVFKFDIMIRETVSNYSYQLYDSLRSSDYWSIFELSVMTDIEFQVGENIFLAHRAIVAARSPVFATMLSSSTVESVTGRIRINDVEPSAFREFLFFLYTGTLQVSADCQALLKLAKHYKIKTLAQICQAAIQDVDVEEIIDSFIEWL